MPVPSNLRVEGTIEWREGHSAPHEAAEELTEDLDGTLWKVLWDEQADEYLLVGEGDEI